MVYTWPTSQSQFFPKQIGGYSCGTTHVNLLATTQTSDSLQISMWWIVSGHACVSPMANWPNQTLLSSCSNQIDLVFVQGHQDKGLPMVLSHDTWLNIEADLLAKQKAATLFTGHLYYRLLGNPWGCCLGTQWIVKQFNTSLCFFVNGHKSIKYWAKQKQVHSNQITGDQLGFTG